MSGIEALEGRRPTWIEVDLDILQANAHLACKTSGSGRVMAVVKADAYGHGAVATTKAFARGGITAFAIALIEEALELRHGGVEDPLVILGPLLAEQIPAALELGAMISIYDFSIAEALEREAIGRGTSLPFHLKLDSGMGRLGVPIPELGMFLERLRGLKHIHMAGIFSHLACADNPDAALTQQQVASFQDAVSAVRQAGHTPADIHLANSAALLRGFPEFCTLTRPGLALYGYSPGPTRIPAGGFRPALAVRSQIVQQKNVPSGTPVGYGSTWVASRDSLIATVPFGYEDGYPRAMGNRADVLIGGCRAPVVGRVSMDLTTVDVTDLTRSGVGEQVTFLGSDGANTIDAWELASWSNTIAWEILCGLGRRVPRLHQTNGSVVSVRAALSGPSTPLPALPLES